LLFSAIETQIIQPSTPKPISAHTSTPTASATAVGPLSPRFKQTASTVLPPIPRDSYTDSDIKNLITGCAFVAQHFVVASDSVSVTPRKARPGSSSFELSIAQRALQMRVGLYRYSLGDVKQAYRELSLIVEKFPTNSTPTSPMSMIEMLKKKAYFLMEKVDIAYQLNSWAALSNDCLTALKIFRRVVR